MLKKFLIFCTFIIVLLFSHIFYNLYIPRYQGENTYFTINPGEGFSKLNYRLSKNKIISNPTFFYRYARLTNILTDFKAGTYEIKSKPNLSDLIDLFTQGNSITKTVVIPEGKNIFEIGKILESQNIVSYNDFIQVAKDPEFAKSLNIPAERVEGYLFPDTYKFSPQTSAESVIKVMVQEFFKKTKDLNFRDSSLSPHEIVTLASVVEKETGASYERPRISGVFHNRLKKRIRLQSDPTTIYGFFENFSGNLRKKDLQTPTPYNTYKKLGLPKGPICNPGVDAIIAAIYPEKHQFLYFVSKNDGTHQFSKTYKEHMQGVNYFQKNRENRVGKSWRDLKEKKNYYQ